MHIIEYLTDEQSRTLNRLSLNERRATINRSFKVAVEDEPVIKREARQIAGQVKGLGAVGVLGIFAAIGRLWPAKEAVIIGSSGHTKEELKLPAEDAEVDWRVTGEGTL